MRVPHPQRSFALPESLEPRTLLSSSFPNVNVSKLAGNQAEGSISIDRANPNNEFALSNIDSGDGLMAATSSDGGHSWSERLIADDTDGLPPACCDPSVSFDTFGNLFVTYVNANVNDVVVLMSTDAGHTFSVLTNFRGNVDQPTLTTGPASTASTASTGSTSSPQASSPQAGSVWVTFQKNNVIFAAGATVSGLGEVGSFTPLQKVPGSGNGNFGDIAIGPAGQIMVTYQVQQSNTLSKIFVDTAAGVADPKFGKAVLATTTHVPDFDYIAAQPDRSIDAEVGLAFDRSGGPFNGRVYLVYTEETPASSGNTDILIRYSDNLGGRWSQPARVNDDTTLNSQFLPRIAVDNTTGQVAVGWYDTRNDLVSGGPGDTDSTSNDDAEYWATLVAPQPTGLLVSPNQQISAGVSNAFDANSDIDYGDYSGLDFYGGTIQPLWFDNSNSTGNNPNGTLHALNPYTAAVPSSAFAVGTNLALGGLGSPTGPVAVLYYHGTTNPGYVRIGSTYAITVVYEPDAAGVGVASLGNANLLVTGPNGFSAAARLGKVKPLKSGAVVATYELINPAGRWNITEDGTYTINLAPGQIMDNAGQTTPGGILGTFAVTSHRGKGSHAGGTGFRHHHQSHD
jgi:hypothetical protein